MARNWPIGLQLAGTVQWCVAAEAKDRGVSFRATHRERTFRAVVGIEVRDVPNMAGGAPTCPPADEDAGCAMAGHDGCALPRMRLLSALAAPPDSRVRRELIVAPA